MSRTACRQSSPSRIDRPYSLRACGNSAPPPSQGVTHRAHPAGTAVVNRTLASPGSGPIGLPFSPLAHRERARSACGRF